jgi:hypothetical protein
MCVFPPLARLLANMAGPDFGSPINQDAKRDDENTLKRITSNRPTYEVHKANISDGRFRSSRLDLSGPAGIEGSGQADQLLCRADGEGGRLRLSGIARRA